VSRFAWICLGGAVGTGARYLLSGWMLAALGSAFPWGTLAVNVIGSFLLGVVMHVGLATPLLTPTARLTLSTGVMGGFTTYSTFNYETIRQIQDGAWPLALVYVGATLLGCLGAGWAGLALARGIFGG
jgi:fluoride exporter